MLHRGRICIPKDEDLRLEIIKLHHDNPVAGHQGHKRTEELILRQYYWSRMGNSVAQYVKRCDKCQRMKNIPEKVQGKLVANQIPEAPWEDISVDFIGGLPPTQGYDSILTVVDRFLKMVHLIPTTEATSTLGLAHLFKDY